MIGGCRRRTGRRSGPRRARGKRFGVPRMYVNADPDAGTAEPGRTPGIGGATGQRIETRASVIELWEAARRDLEAAGAEVVEVDFPVVSNYEGDRPGAPTIATRGLVSPEYLRREIVDLSAWAWNDFLDANGDPALHALADVDGAAHLPAARRAPCPTATRASTTTSPSTPSGRAPHPGATLADMPELEAGCAGSRRPAASTSSSGWTTSASTPSCSPRSPTSAPPTWT